MFILKIVRNKWFLVIKSFLVIATIRCVSFVLGTYKRRW